MVIVLRKNYKTNKLTKKTQLLILFTQKEDYYVAA